MASIGQFTILRNALAEQLGEAISKGVCDATEALMLFEDVLLTVEDDHDVTFPGSRLTITAEKLLRLAQERPL